MSTTKTKSPNSSKIESNQLLEDSMDHNHHHVKPKRKAPARPSGNKSNTPASSSSKPHARVKKKTATGSLKHEGEAGGKTNRKISPSSASDEIADEVKDAKLRRIVSPRKEQYSHLLDEMIGCGDMVLLEPLTEDNIIENLKKRYTAGDIYVRVHTLTLLVTCHRLVQWNLTIMVTYKSRLI